MAIGPVLNFSVKVKKIKANLNLLMDISKNSDYKL